MRILVFTAEPKLTYLDKLFVRLAFTDYIIFAFFRRCEHVFAYNTVQNHKFNPCQVLFLNLKLFDALNI